MNLIEPGNATIKNGVAGKRNGALFGFAVAMGNRDAGVGIVVRAAEPPI